MPRIRRRLFTFVFLLAITAPLGGQSDRAPSVPNHALTQESLRLFPELPARPLPPHAPLPPIYGDPITLPQMVRASGAIFTGTVTAIARSPVSAKNAVATVAITFHVTHGMQGVVTGQDFTLHQWIGLWNSGQQRYRMGEQVLLFLYPASKLGLTSCVAGSLGRFPIDNLGRVLFLPQHISAFRTDPILGGNSSVDIQAFAWAVRRAGGEGVAAR